MLSAGRGSEAGYRTSSSQAGGGERPDWTKPWRRAKPRPNWQVINWVEKYGFRSYNYFFPRWGVVAFFWQFFKPNIHLDLQVDATCKTFQFLPRLKRWGAVMQLSSSRSPFCPVSKPPWVLTAQSIWCQEIELVQYFLKQGWGRNSHLPLTNIQIRYQPRGDQG